MKNRDDKTVYGYRETVYCHVYYVSIRGCWGERGNGKKTEDNMCAKKLLE